MENLIDQVRVWRRLPAPAACRAIRLGAGVSQECLACEIGVHRVTVARWECGARKPRGRLLRRSVEVLEMLQRELAREDSQASSCASASPVATARQSSPPQFSPDPPSAVATEPRGGE